MREGEIQKYVPDFNKGSNLGLRGRAVGAPTKKKAEEELSGRSRCLLNVSGLREEILLPL